MHRVIVVHDGQTYIVILDFIMRDGLLAVSVKEVIKVSALNHNLKVA